MNETIHKGVMESFSSFFVNPKYILDPNVEKFKFLSNNQIEKYLDEKIIKAYFTLGSKFKENEAQIFLVLSK